MLEIGQSILMEPICDWSGVGPLCVTRWLIDDLPPVEDMGFDQAKGAGVFSGRLSTCFLTNLRARNL